MFFIFVDFLSDFVDAVTLIRLILLHHNNHVKSQLAFVGMRLHLGDQCGRLVVLLDRLEAAHMKEVACLKRRHSSLFLLSLVFSTASLVFEQVGIDHFVNGLITVLQRQ